MPAVSINDPLKSITSITEKHSVPKAAKIIVTMPAYNAAKTLLKTFEEIPKGLVSEIITGRRLFGR